MGKRKRKTEHVERAQVFFCYEEERMTLPKGYKLPPAEKERIEKIEREHARLRNNARGIDPEYQARVQQAQRRRLQKMALGIIGLCLFPVLIVAAAITMNWYLIGAFLVGLAVIAAFAFSGSAHSTNTGYAAGHYWGAARARSFRMFAADRATRKKG
jgi:hypothetical protein